MPYNSNCSQLLGLSDALATNRTISVPDGTLEYQVSNLVAGASYQVQAYTIFKEKESLAYTSRNFTTSKCAARFLRGSRRGGFWWSRWLGKYRHIHTNYAIIIYGARVLTHIHTHTNTQSRVADSVDFPLRFACHWARSVHTTKRTQYKQHTPTHVLAHTCCIQILRARVVPRRK